MWQLWQPISFILAQEHSGRPIKHQPAHCTCPGLPSQKGAPFMLIQARAPPSAVPLRSLFRTMGLRHMFVSPPHPLVSGLVTRKDIITGALLH